MQILVELTKSGVFLRQRSTSKMAVLLIHGFFLFQLIGCGNSQSSADEFLPGSSTPEVINTGAKPQAASESSIKIENDDLLRNQQIWNEKKILNYDLIASLYIGGVKGWPEPVFIEVRNGSAVSIKADDPGELSIEGYREFDTIEKLFSAIQKGIENGAEVSVKYNKHLSYPEEVYINYFRKGSDQYKRLVIRKFSKIGPS